MKRFYPFALNLSSTFRWNCNLPKFFLERPSWIWLISVKSFLSLSSYLFVSYSSIYFIRFSMNILFAAFAAGGLKPSSHSPTYRVLICVALKRSGLIPCDFCRWWAQVDSNHRPRAYQARALTTWAMSPFSFFGISRSLSPLVEMMGIEPMTPCLQGRCSPSWATPPYRVNEKWRVKSEKWRVSVEKASLFLHLIFIVLSFLFGHSKSNNKWKYSA